MTQDAPAPEPAPRSAIVYAKPASAVARANAATVVGTLAVIAEGVVMNAQGDVLNANGTVSNPGHLFNQLLTLSDAELGVLVFQLHQFVVGLLESWRVEVLVATGLLPALVLVLAARRMKS